MQTHASTGTGIMHKEGTSYSCLKPKEGAKVQSSRKCARFTAAEGECPSLPVQPLVPAAKGLQPRSPCQHLQPCLQFLTPAELRVSQIYLPTDINFLCSCLSFLQLLFRKAHSVGEYHVIKWEGGDTFQLVTGLFSPSSLCTAGQLFD